MSKVRGGVVNTPRPRPGLDPRRYGQREGKEKGGGGAGRLGWDEGEQMYPIH